MLLGRGSSLRAWVKKSVAINVADKQIAMHIPVICRLPMSRTLIHSCGRLLKIQRSWVGRFWALCNAESAPKRRTTSSSISINQSTRPFVDADVHRWWAQADKSSDVVANNVHNWCIQFESVTGVCCRRLEQRCGNSEDRIAWYWFCARPDHRGLVEHLERAPTDAPGGKCHGSRQDMCHGCRQRFDNVGFSTESRKKVLKQCMNVTAKYHKNA